MLYRRSLVSLQYALPLAEIGGDVSGWCCLFACSGANVTEAANFKYLCKTIAYLWGMSTWIGVGAIGGVSLSSRVSYGMRMQQRPITRDPSNVGLRKVPPLLPALA